MQSPRPDLNVAWLDQYFLNLSTFLSKLIWKDISKKGNEKKLFAGHNHQKSPPLRGPDLSSLADHRQKFIVESKVVQGNIPMYTRPTNDVRINWLLQDE